MNRPHRPLPAVTPFNEWFWTAGADGVLRIQGCDACGQLVHPPTPICPQCGGRQQSPKDVSGYATVVGCTVNHQRWLPGFEPPYAIATVALTEDPSVRLTTNVVGCDPTEVHIGQPVAVHFEQYDDVWLPLFTPTTDTFAEAVVDDDASVIIRPPVRTSRYEHDAVLTGVGRSDMGRRLMRDPLSLTIDACLAAIADAGLTPADIDGMSTYPGPHGWEIGISEGGITAVEEALRIHPTWINGGGEIAGPGGSIQAAAMAVSAGLCRHVLCFRTVWQTTAAASGLGGGEGRLTGGMEYRMPYGAMSAANWIGVNATRYLQRYGATRELLGMVAVNSRVNAGRNPAAIYREPMTMDDYLNARMVSTPFGLFDCDVPCDASIAVIVSATDTAGDLPHPAVRIEAIGSQIAERIAWDQGTLTHEPQVLGPAKHLWTRTSMTTADVDLALLYDGFTFNAVTWIEALGFCGIGEAQAWMDGGRSIALDGVLPLNPHGGQLSEGRTHGYGFIYEAVTQLRHDAGERQVGGAATAVVSTGGLTPSGVMLLTTHDVG